MVTLMVHHTVQLVTVLLDMVATHTLPLLHTVHQTLTVQDTLPQLHTEVTHMAHHTEVTHTHLVTLLPHE